MLACIGGMEHPYLQTPYLRDPNAHEPLKLRCCFGLQSPRNRKPPTNARHLKRCFWRVRVTVLDPQTPTHGTKGFLSFVVPPHYSRPLPPCQLERFCCFCLCSWFEWSPPTKKTRTLPGKKGETKSRAPRACALFGFAGPAFAGCPKAFVREHLADPRREQGQQPVFRAQWKPIC